MKQIIYLLLTSIFFSTTIHAQNVGLGIDVPIAGLHVITNNSIVARGTLGAGNTINESGAGSMLLFNTKKGAFRVGYLDANNGNYWNDASTGLYSVGMGFNAKATGAGALALGTYCEASGTSSMAIGASGKAAGNGSIALSNLAAYANGSYSLAMGKSANANTYGSVAIGTSINAGYPADETGYNSFVFGMGENVTFNSGGHFAIGDRSFAVGNNCRSIATRAFSIGNDCYNVGNYAFAFGNSSSATGNYSFAIGNNAYTNGHQGAMVLGSRIDGIPVLSPADFHLLTQFAGGYQFQSNNAGTLGVYLQPNSSSWQSICDSTKKEQVIPMDDEVMLKRLAAINYASWKYKDDPDASNRHYGIMAQDFYASFGKDGLGKIGCDTLVNPIDLLGVAYSAIKALEKRTGEIEVLKAENEALKGRLQKIENLLAGNNFLVPGLASK